MGRFKSRRHDDLDPEVVSVETTNRILDQSEKQTMCDVRAGLLESYLLGRRRRISLRSIRALAAKRLAEADPNARHPQAAIASAGAVEKHRRERERAPESNHPGD
jgi:hypothetical protein